MWYRLHMPKEDLHIRVETEIMQPVREIAAQNGISVAAAASIVMKLGVQAYRAAKPHKNGDQE